MAGTLPNKQKTGPQDGAACQVGLAYWQRWNAENATAAAQAETARAKLALNTTEQIANALMLNLGKGPRLLSLPPDLTREIFDGATEGYSQVIKLDPLNPMTYNNRGNAFFRKANLDGDAADYDKAIVDYGNAIALDRNYAIAYSNRCWARVVAAKQLQRALSDCDAALRIDPKNIRALDNRGFAYLKLGRVNDALESFNAALKIDPKFPTALYGRGLAKLKAEDRKGAEADMAAATAIEIDVAECTLQLLELNRGCVPFPAR